IADHIRKAPVTRPQSRRVQELRGRPERVPARQGEHRAHDPVFHDASTTPLRVAPVSAGLDLSTTFGTLLTGKERSHWCLYCTSVICPVWASRSTVLAPCAGARFSPAPSKTARNRPCNANVAPCWLTC